MKNRKAQVTVFIIIGLVILITASFFLYFRNLAVPEAEFIQEDLRPIKNYIDFCLNDIGEEAVIRLGSQGGYINIPDELKMNRAYVEFIPRSPIKIPYWYYNGIDIIPTIDSMENEITNYIENNLEGCADLSVFEDEYDIEVVTEPDVTTIIGNDDIDIELSYEVIIRDKSTGEPTKISRYQTTLPVRLKQIYELGKKIMEAENQKTYFENITIDWVSMNKNIPLNGIEFHCSNLRWRVRDVKEELQDMIYYNMPRIKVKDTDHPEFIEDEKVYEKLKEYTLEDINKGDYPDIATPADAYDYSHYLLDVRTKKTNLKAGFAYQPTWGLDMVVRPSEDGIMRSIKQSASEEFLSFMCLNTYHFTYDIIYPVEVLVRDDESFNNQGYVFRYAFPVMVNHNQPDRSGFFNPEFIMIGSDFTGQCGSLEGPIYDIRAYGVDEYGIAGVELDDVNISYDCYKFRCSLGQTNADYGYYRLRTQLPDTCANGFLVAEKPGYLKEKQQILTNNEIDIDLKKIKTLNFEVMMNQYDPTTNEIKGSELVTEPFVALVDFQSIDEPSLSSFRKYPIESNEEKTIDLLEQNSQYKVEITLMDEADGTLIGGYLNNITLDYDSIANSDKIIFYAASYLPKAMNRNQEYDVTKFLEENNIYKQQLLPILE
jgi:hypothetical protein